MTCHNYLLVLALYYTKLIWLWLRWICDVFILNLSQIRKRTNSLLPKSIYLNFQQINVYNISVISHSCVSVLYIGHILNEPGCLFEVTAMRIVRRACLYLISLSPLWWLSLSLVPLVRSRVEDAPVPLWLQHNLKGIERATHEKGAI